MSSAPGHTPKDEQLGETWTVPSNPGAGSTEKNRNAKKCKLHWHFKCLQAAGVDVKFPEEG